MSKMALRHSAALIALVLVAMPAGAQESAIPNFTSANFGWLANSGFDFRPIEGNAAPVGGADPYWRGGIGLPTSDFNYQPPEAAADPRRQGPSRIGPWNIERLSAENPNLTPWAAAQMRMHNELVSKGRRAFSAMSRCWPGGPAQLLFNAEPLYFIQTQQEVWFVAAGSSRPPRLS
jgi:hypothetical protein